MKWRIASLLLTVLDVGNNHVGNCFAVHVVAAADETAATTRREQQLLEQQQGGHASTNNVVNNNNMSTTTTTNTRRTTTTHPVVGSEMTTSMRRRTLDSSVGGNPVSTSGNIVGGVNAKPGSYPFYATANGDCGATLIHADILLTAGHCFDAFNNGITIDSTDLKRRKQGQSLTVLTQYRHESYNPTTFQNDIMLLLLTKPAPSNITPAPYATLSSEPYPGDTVTVIGFGDTSYQGSESSQLREVDITIFNDANCTSDYSSGGYYSDVMFCAGNLGGGKDSCQGDSGGPLLTNAGVQVGIVSWGIGCADAAYPGVNTRVGYFADWIQNGICQLSSKPSFEHCPICQHKCKLLSLVDGYTVHRKGRLGGDCKEQCFSAGSVRSLMQLFRYQCGPCPSSNN